MCLLTTFRNFYDWVLLVISNIQACKPKKLKQDDGNKIL